MDTATKTSHSADVVNFWYTKHAFKHPDVSIGEYTYGLPKILLDKPGTKITIGKFCSIGDNVQINVYSERDLAMVSNYPFSSLKTDWPNAAKEKIVNVKGDITIGNDVWIGSNAVILGGVTIGDGAIIGAHAVVAKDVAPYSVVAGNPIREIRKRLAEDDIAKLLEIKWWDWPVEKIQKYTVLLTSNDVNGLYKVRD